MKRHIESVHKGKKPFKCQICKHPFGAKADLKRHLSSIHKEIYHDYICQEFAINLTHNTISLAIEVRETDPVSVTFVSLDPFIRM